MLTKDEIEEVFQSVANDDPEVHLRFAAAVIAAHTAKVPGDVEPVAFMFQHSETGRIAFVDAWQKENGWALANPRYSEVGTMHGASTVASLTAQRDQALARVAELEKDAARYQWLRDGDICADYPYPVMRTGGWQDGQTIWADELDAAIDAFLTKGQP